MGDKRNKGQKFLIALTVIIIVGIGAAIAIGAAQERALQAKIAEAKAAGFPFDPEDLVPKVMPAPNENAATLYLSLKPLESSLVFTDRQAGTSSLGRLFSGDPKPGDAGALAIYIAEADPVIERFVAASQRPRCYFEHDWSKGANVLLPEYADVKHAAKLTLARALDRAATGSTSAAQDVAAVRRAADHIREQPTLIALLVANALDSMVTKAVELALPRADGRPDLIKALRSEVELLPEAWDLSNALRGESYFAWWCSEHLHEMASYMDHSVDFLERMAANSHTVSRGLKTAVLDTHGVAFAKYKPGDDERDVLSALQADLDAKVAESLFVGGFLGIISPAFNGLPDSIDRQRARRRCVLAAMTVVEHRGEHGEWPATLADAGLEPVDPFDGQPLRYRAVGAGFRVWSVGRDRKDDGGLTRREGQGSHDEVVVFDPHLSPR